MYPKVMSDFRRRDRGQNAYRHYMEEDPAHIVAVPLMRRRMRGGMQIGNMLVFMVGFIVLVNAESIVRCYWGRDFEH
jgi:hypothetical protein